MGSLLLKGCTVAVTGDGVAVEDALLLLSWIPAEDVSDATGMTTGKESGSHFPVIINTRTLYNNEVGRRHMMSQAHLTCDYCCGLAVPWRFPTVMREARTRRRRRRHGWPDRSVDTSLPLSWFNSPHVAPSRPTAHDSPRHRVSTETTDDCPTTARTRPRRTTLPPRERCNSRDATDDPRAFWAPTARPPPSRWY